ncbi:hypothetical protein ACFE04_000730 [Oxalis oulophora]
MEKIEKEIFGKCIKNYSNVPGRIEFDGCKSFKSNLKSPFLCSECGCERDHHQLLKYYIGVDLKPTQRPIFMSSNSGSRNTDQAPTNVNLVGTGNGDLVANTCTTPICTACRRAIETDGKNVGFNIGEANGTTSVLHHGIPISLNMQRMQNRDGLMIDENADTLPDCYFNKPKNKRKKMNRG